jgi:hypothetical protein
VAGGKKQENEKYRCHNPGKDHFASGGSARDGYQFMNLTGYHTFSRK